ncbi:TatD family hydrolase [Geobacter hydrogenophilus]|uniref:TatD family hydrolase n=1 Tax=Geobacter hydrogenophilus TaxID=40983 RepID=A0A9W6FZ29_9BACT|nr:TatD family hydrolase [Geobacter hydrogenophilus]MBT0893575.1 TatD family hydrolase [Geobacter hydrogenophilus]GLI37729.1 TatD family hydrolase [Geobacter hydrogenophilus]
MLTDTHCHLDDPILSSRLGEVMAAARQARIGRIIVPGVAPGGWERIASLAREHEGIFPAFGIHPQAADQANDDALARLTILANSAVALGEIGLDHLPHHVPRSTQETALREQLRIAVAAGLPVIIHCRRAFEPLLRILREEGVSRVGGVMHAFSGSVEIARECIRLGLFISVAGTVTYRNAVRPVAVAREIPLEHLLLETDAPDMTPEPFRGNHNEPAFLPVTAHRLAELKGIAAAHVALITDSNAARLFRLSAL